LTDGFEVYYGASNLALEEKAVIETTKRHQCRKCGSENIVKNGHDHKGSQKYLCRNCGSGATLVPFQAYSFERKMEILMAYQERPSMRGIQRVFGVARTTLSDWLKNLGDCLPSVGETLDSPKPDDVLELDELWSYVFSKDNQRWVWIALCRRTRQVVAYYIGDRSAESAKQLWERIPTQYRGCRTFSDYWDAYNKVFPNNTAMGKESGETNHVERWNCSLRQRLGRFARKTLSFSKSDYFHEIALLFFIVTYNLSLIS